MTLIQSFDFCVVTYVIVFISEYLFGEFLNNSRLLHFYLTFSGVWSESCSDVQFSDNKIYHSTWCNRLTSFSPGALSRCYRIPSGKFPNWAQTNKTPAPTACSYLHVNRRGLSSQLSRLTTHSLSWRGNGYLSSIVTT